MAETYLLKCKNCGGILDGDEDGDNILVCPYCGSKELMIESDAVKIAKIKSEAYKEVELGKQKILAEQLKKNSEKPFNRTATFIFAVIMFTVFLVFCFAAFGTYRYASGTVAIIQLGLLVLSMLFGFGVIKKKPRVISTLLVIASAVLIIPFCAMIGEDSTPPRSYSSPESKDFAWSEMIMQEALPDPGSSAGYVYSNTNERLNVELGPYTQEQFNEYVTACKNAGYTIDLTASYESSYEAYNEEGYHLDLYYYSSSQELSLCLDAPIEMSEFTWPSHGLAGLLPAPSSNIGKISSDSADYFYAYVGETGRDEYVTYVEECIEAGFDVDYYRYDDYFSAKNEDGVDLSIDYLGFKTIRIRLSHYNY